MQANYKPEICMRCRGTGGTPKYYLQVDIYTTIPIEFERCPACNGQGNVLVAQPATNCAWCGGRGWVKDLIKYVPCPSCNGTGWAHAKVRQKID